ncbi:MAG: transcriptional regulator GcvA, partial [Geminicoccaceae bacterium]
MRKIDVTHPKPPFGSLRTFEAAARHLSFTKAAAELFVTQTAVSHQIKTLEAHLGVPLFRRLNRALLLTDEGQTLLPYVRDAFGSLDAGLRRLADKAAGSTLSITTTPGFAASWLAPRLVHFQAKYPEIEIQLNSASRVLDLAYEGLDCAIRYGLGDWPGTHAEQLFHTPLIPVCAPSYLANSGKGLDAPTDLDGHKLLHVLGDLDDWRLWLQAAGVDGVDPSRGPKFDTMPLVLQAAISGAGIAIARAPLVREELKGGRLVAPFDFEVPETCAYY